MITHVGTVCIFVADQDRAKKFYVEKLGFEERIDAPMGDGTRWVSVAPPAANTEIVLIQNFGDWAPDKVGGRINGCLEVDDVFQTGKQWGAKGVEFPTAPSMEFFGGWATFKDSEGNEWGLHSPVRETADAK